MNIRVLVIGKDTLGADSLLEAFKWYYKMYVKMNNGNGAFYYRFDYFIEPYPEHFYRVSFKFETKEEYSPSDLKDDHFDYIIRCFDAWSEFDLTHFESLDELADIVNSHENKYLMALINHCDAVEWVIETDELKYYCEKIGA